VSDATSVRSGAREAPTAAAVRRAPDLRDAWTRLVASLGAGTRTFRATTGLLAFLVVFGVVLRVYAMADPPFFTFDEEMFARNAAHYLVGSADQNDHPPVGKLIIAVGFLLFGYDSLGWRFAPLVFGLHQLVIGYWLGSRLFESRRAGAMVAAFLAADGFFIAYSRCGLMDGILTCVVLWAMLAAVTATRVRHVLVAVLLCGVAMSVKWSGAMSVIPAAAAIWVLGRAPKASVLTFALVPVVHALIWMGGLRITGQPADPLSWWNVAKGLFWHHVELGTHDNLLASHWYSWIYLYHPIVTKLSYQGLGQRYSSSAGNVLLWASGSLLVLATPLVAIGLAVRARFRARRAARVPLDPFFARALLLALGWLALLLPWMLGRGKYTFSYHYLPSYGFALVLVGGAVARLERRHVAAGLAFVAAVTAISLYFAPVWMELSLPDAVANRRLIFVPWRP
jgi:dolichyl-phosphate-mannose-protein mannosyltransferase